jgi:hypothetical protein
MVRPHAALLLGLSLCFNPARSAEGLIPPLSSEQAARVRQTIEDFKRNPRGPYYRIRWFCKDGTVHPPNPYPCADRGGGNQHAELSDAARRLAQWNIDVGTILATAPFDAVFDAPRGHHRLKQLVLEKYLMEIDNGWIYRRAVSYRGARQIEDEEKAGRRLLETMFSRPEWLDKNFFLAMQLIDAIPHGVADSAIKRIRTLASQIAAADPRFQFLRSKIHSYPDASDEDAVRAWLRDKNPPDEIAAKLKELADLIQAQYATRKLTERVETLAARFSKTDVGAALTRLSEALRLRSPEQVCDALAAASLAIRKQAASTQDGRANLALLDINRDLHEAAFRFERPPPTAPRSELLDDLDAHFRLSAGGGLISLRQLEALQSELKTLRARATHSPQDWRNSVRYLARAAEWSRATVGAEFGPAVRLYSSFEPKAAGLVDHLLRSSMALPLSTRIEVLLHDADLAAGVRHYLFGRPSGGGVTALNPGIAAGRLGIIEPGSEMAPAVNPNLIYVIPETASDLKPMAGILTLDSGNALSHAQLLAAGLGIPNASVPSTLLPELRAREGKEIFYAVTPRGVVVLKEKQDLTEEERKLWAAQPSQQGGPVLLDTSRLDLEYRNLPLLDELLASHSGAIVGPKAANLGQLGHLFAEKVAGGFAVPFGVYAAHIRRDLDGDGKTLEEEIAAVLQQAERMRDSGVDSLEIRRFAYPKLARFRQTVENIPLLPEFERQVRERLRSKFGPDGSYGVFVRSDTNAEDLPEFTGAGLNRTVPNVVGEARILSAIRQVWASPLTERAFDWRLRALRAAGRVYPSVVVMRAVNSDKSGVIATINLETGATGESTVNVSEGVSAVVDGGVAESLLLRADGTAKLLQQCRATYRKVCDPKGGFAFLPPIGGDYVLTRAEILKVRDLIEEVKQKYPPEMASDGKPLPWDIEFGFENGELRLFQIRPLARYREIEVLRALSRLERDAAPSGAVRLAERPFGL